MLRKLAVLLIIFLLSSCGVKNVRKTNELTGDKKIGIINESFDPLILDDEDIKIRENKKVVAKSDLGDSFITNIDENKNIESEEVNGYRVQICAVPDEELARETQREAILKFNENIYFVYDSPYYKVRIGDCTTRFEADRLQKLAEEKGFHEAWVVRTKVKMNAKLNRDENESTETNEKEF